MSGGIVGVLDLDRNHLGRYVDTGAVAGTLTVLHDAYHGGSPCRTLMIDTADGEIASVTYSGKGSEFSHLPWSSIVLVDSPTELSDSMSCDMGPYLSPETNANWSPLSSDVDLGVGHDHHHRPGTGVRSRVLRLRIGSVLPGFQPLPRGPPRCGTCCPVRRSSAPRGRRSARCR